MASPDKEQRKKGTFSGIRLAVTKKYIFPASRRRMMLIGAAGCAALLLYFAVNTFFMSSSFVSTGPLSSNHATFEAECAKCHSSFKAVSDAQCSTCHEKAGDKTGAYSFAAHYLYKSGDPTRAGAAHKGNEMDCASCHPEHNGREQAITRVPDAKCIQCHMYGSFNDAHPEFVRNEVPDDSTLIFTHIKHTKLVVEKIQAETGSVYAEKACLYCHTPQGDGKNFKPLDFDVQCADCHLTTASETPSLAVRDPRNPIMPGVETLEMIQRRRGPGMQWAFYTNPNEFTVKGGGRIAKSPVYHKDPWILENLKSIRQILYTDSGLSDLLKAPGKTDARAYREAIQTLREYVAGLRSRPEPEIQADLVRIDSVLRMASEKLKTNPLPDLSMAMRTENPDLTPAQKQELQDFALKLAKPCLECHVVSNASIMRVNADQRGLQRSEFDHRAHILERRCLECHVEIPIAEALDGDTKIDIFKDRSSTQNLPMKGNCVECHSSAAASNLCVTCHLMHPNKNKSLQLFVDAR